MRLRRHLSDLPPEVTRALEAFEKQSKRPELPQPAARRQLVQPNHKLQPAEIDELVVAYEAGASIDALARDFTLYHQTVRAHLQRRGVVLRPQAVLTPAQVERAIVSYQAGRSLRQVATEFDTTYSSIRNYLLRAGVTLRPARRVPHLGVD